MGRDRFWFGAALLFLPFVGLRLSLANPADSAQGGAIDGHITIHGRPLTGGYVVLYPEDNSCSPITAKIDGRGDFYAAPRKIWKPSPETRFKITVWPKERRYWSEVDIAAIRPELKRLLRPQTSDLSVRLGTQPATIDIHL